MGWSFPIGRLFGSELRVHATFFLLLAWIGAVAWAEGGPQAALVNVLFILALFACVVAHEFGHALTARRYGIRTPDITLLPIGGVARLERMPEKPSQEIIVALAGPAVNVVIWAILVGVFGAYASMQELAHIETPQIDFFARLAAVNLFLAVFNLIPAFPMDGGRVLRALLSISMDRVRATRVAATAGQMIAFLFGFWGLASGNLILLLIAVFVYLAGQAEASDVAMRDLARRISARDAMITAFEPLMPDDTLAAMSAGLLRTTQHEFPVLDPAGRLLGFVTREAIFAAAQGDRAGVHAGDLMVSEIPRVPRAAPLSQVLDALSSSGAPAVAVVDPAGRMLGYITRENIGELMVLRGGNGR
ncbi:MAG: site-2 protease family protein [Alphaproteobacteria bacterium]|nr:MAG: site-2 protease family protein [Alphaproteobacteria bacterium]